MLKKICNNVGLGMAVLLLCGLLTSCAAEKESEDPAAESADVNPAAVEFDAEDLETGWDEADAVEIMMQQDEITCTGEGAVVNGSTVTIISGGVYVLSGVLDEGQVVVNAQDEQTVRLVLNGAELNCTNSAPIYVQQAEKAVITLAEGTQNIITDGDNYVLAAGTDEPSAAVFSKDDLVINGSGSLAVSGNYQDGITGKDGLKIIGGDIAVQAAHDGIRGRDYIAVLDGNISINAETDDGMQANNDEDAAKGFIYIAGGTIDITAAADGIQGETVIFIEDGNININAGGGSGEASPQKEDRFPHWDYDDSRNTEDTGSAKGIKAGSDITVVGGSITVDSLDDAVHANGSITMSAGNLELTSGDDAVHADTIVSLKGGKINIEQCYEGIESESIVINDGVYYITAADDGVNAAGGTDDSAMERGRMNPGSGDCNLLITGGYVWIDAQGDGIDINGSLTVDGGTVIVNGPTSSADGALDYYGTCEINGGLLVAAGSAGMAQAPGNSSAQNSIYLNLESVQPAGTLLHIAGEDGTEILTFTPVKDYQSVIVSAPELQTGSVYNVFVGGNYDGGTCRDGICAAGSYNGGSKAAGLEITAPVTGSGSTVPGGGMPGGGRPGPGEMPEDLPDFEGWEDRKNNVPPSQERPAG